MPHADGWKEHARCKALPDEEADRMFFPEEGTNASYKEAEAFCQQCPVRMTCLTYAIVFRINSGAWGGLSPTRRRLFARGRRAAIVQAWKDRFPTTLERIS